MLKIDLHKTFKTRQRTTEISCSGQFELGVTSAIYGKSGVGKSTVLRMIAGLEKADSGNIHFNDEVWFDETTKIDRPIAERNIGFVFQDFNLFPNMTVLQNLEYARPKKTPKQRINQLLDIADLVALKNRKPNKKVSFGNGL